MSHLKKLSFSCAVMIDVSNKQKSVMDPMKKETIVDLCHLVAGQGELGHPGKMFSVRL